MNTLLTLGVLCAVVCVNRVIATIPAYDYVSCHVDTPVRDLPHNILWNQPVMSADICAVHCLGYRYFGTQVIKNSTKNNYKNDNLFQIKILLRIVVN